MFIQHFKKTDCRKKIYISVFLIENYRENDKFKRRYLLNFPKWLQKQINAMETALKSSHKGQSFIARNASKLHIALCKKIGRIAMANAFMDRLSISMALGQTMQAQLVSLMITGHQLFPKTGATQKMKL